MPAIRYGGYIMVTSEGAITYFVTFLFCITGQCKTLASDVSFWGDHKFVQFYVKLKFILKYIFKYNDYILFIKPVHLSTCH